MRYWWVNHNRTVRQEIGGGYLWSPKREQNGAKSQFYDNMRLASPGDFVLSFAEGQIAHVGAVADYPLSAAKPDTFGAAGANWNSDGWLLPMRWSPLPLPVLPRVLLPQLRAWLPAKYSPIHPETGNGNQKAYLAEINEKIFSSVVTAAGIAAPLALSSDALGSRIVNQLDDDCERAINSDEHLTATEKKQLINARYGQGIFRTRVCDIEHSCRLTRVANPILLIASHIKPWRMCSTATERLDGHNGLLLAPHVDRLFDRGLMSFSDQGDVMPSSRLDRSDIEKLGLGPAFTTSCGSFSLAQRSYLKFHRENVFLP